LDACRAEEDLNKEMKDCEWWSVDIDLSLDVFKVDFVIMSSTSADVDNNRSRDYSLPLVNALTEEEIIANRIAEFEAFEATRKKVLLLLLFVNMGQGGGRGDAESRQLFVLRFVEWGEQTIEEEESKLWENILVAAEEEAERESAKLNEETAQRRRKAAQEV
jgi:hypothetical protein